MACILTRKELRSIELLAQRLEDQGLVAESKTLRDIVRVSSGRQEVRAAVAAEILHVTPQTIRNWVKRGLLPGRIDETDHIFVDVDAIMPALEMDAVMPYQPASAPDISIDEINAEIIAHRAERHAG